ncbi:hypothetical protein DFH08DRAFT_957354 [Mycena albidolilacea]|uniref:Uncharacterized protein n=1 Tax=Mycena albidolilacea TaxID=1033008 RepID=A0AAD7A9B2_9AGAR|nr:hypothetical protein DFH08DRAFT_957354 [Mycena albidolilacea]
MAAQWEADIDALNPFETQHKDKHVAKDLGGAGREAVGIEAVGAVRGDMHIMELVGMGLQWILGSDVTSTGLHPTDGQHCAMIEQMSKLWCKIFTWIEVLTKWGGGEPILGIAVSNIKLWLPSAIAGIEWAKAKTQALGECFVKGWKALPDLILQGRAGGLGKEDNVVAAVEEDEENREGEDKSDEEEKPIGSLPQHEIKASYVDEVLSM